MLPRPISGTRTAIVNDSPGFDPYKEESQVGAEANPDDAERPTKQASTCELTHMLKQKITATDDNI